MPALSTLDAHALAHTALFQGICPERIASLLPCIGSRLEAYDKGDWLLHAGQTTREFGLVLSGSVLVQTTDVWGDTSLLAHVTQGKAFGEVYACLPEEPLFVDVVAAEPTQVLFADAAKVLHPCANACPGHQSLSNNLLVALARQSLSLARRSVHTAPKTIRGKVLAYLSDQARACGSPSFEIALNRQQLAHYLGVDRSALSAELSRMRADGLIEFERGHFALLDV